MTVQNQNVKNVYRGNGSTTEFPFTFAINADHPEYIHVYITNDGEQAVETTDFACDMNARTVTYPKPGSSAPELSATQRLTIYRKLPYTQELNLVNQGPFFSEDVEQTFDDQEMQIQQLNEEKERSLRVGLETTNFDTVIPLVPGKTFRVKDDGSGFEVTEDPAVAMRAAQDAQAAAERAQGAAEDAQDAAEKAQGKAEDAKDDAETAAALAERHMTWFDTVADMKAEEIPAGMTVGTKGYSAVNDGGNSLYVVREALVGETYNDSTLILLNNGKVAEKILEPGNEINPDAFPGDTDAVKLQNAIDYAVAQKASTILIARKFDITGSTLNINKRLANADDYHRQKLTFLGTGTGEIFKGDGGYIFSGTISHSSTYQYSAGDITFINVKFKGRTTPLNTGDLDRAFLCSVFDCSKLIRLTCITCSYTSVGVVFDGKDCNSAESTAENPASNAQQLYSYGDICAYSHAYITVKKLWCCTFNGATVENCNYGALGLQDETNGTTINELHFVECCIENCPYGDIVFEDGTDKTKYIMTSLQIKGCYFEGSGHSHASDAEVILHYRWNYCCVIKDNHFAMITEAKACDLWIYNNLWVLDNNSSTLGKPLFYVSDGANFYYNNNVAHRNNVGGSDLTNNENAINNGINTYYRMFKDVAVSVSDSLNFGSYSATSNDVLTNLPRTGKGAVYSFPSKDGTLFEIYIDEANAIWYRSYNTTVGVWQSWKPLLTAYSFEANNVKDLDDINLPFPVISKSVATFSFKLNYGVNVATFAAAQILSRGDTTVSFRPKKYDGTTATATDFCVVVTITPILDSYS